MQAAHASHTGAAHTGASHTRDASDFDRPRRRAAAPVHDHHRQANIVATVALTILALLAVASVGGAIMYLPDYIERQKLEARLGPKMNMAPLPMVKVEMGGLAGLSMDLKLAIELEPGVRPSKVEPYFDRIVDRMGDRLRDVGLERLNGAEGAKLVKEMARSVTQQELKKIKVRDVLIEKMVLRSGYSD